MATAGWGRARLESSKAKQVKDFLLWLFEVADPAVTRGEEITARQILERGALQIETELAGQPELQAEMLHTVGVVYRRLGLFEQAQPLLERSLEMRRRSHGPEHLDVAQSLFDLSWVLDERGQYEEAERLHRESLAVRRRLLAPDDPAVAKSLNDLGVVLYRKGNLRPGGAAVAGNPRDPVPGLRRGAPRRRRDHGQPGGGAA